MDDVPSSFPDRNEVDFPDACSKIDSVVDGVNFKQAASKILASASSTTPQAQDNSPQLKESTSSAISGGKKRRRRQNWIDTASNETTELLEGILSDTAKFLAPMPSVVSLRNGVKDPPLTHAFTPLALRRRSNGNGNISGSNRSSNSGSSIDIFDNSNNNVSTVRIEEGVEGNDEYHHNLRDHMRGFHQLPSIHAIEQQRCQHYNDDNGSLLTPNRGHHVLIRALEVLEDFEKNESELKLKSPLTTSLTKIATGDGRYRSPRDAVNMLEELSRSVPRRVCQHPFKKNDIVWVCRTCQADETCVLCHACFKGSDHEGHDVAFYHAQAGGCCDCGDPDAWDPAGFCNKHGPAAAGYNSFSGTHNLEDDDDESVRNLGPLSGSVVFRVQGLVPAAMNWMVKYVATAAKEGYARTENKEENKTITEEGDVEMKDSQISQPVHTKKEVASKTDERSDSRSIFSPSAAGSSRRHQKDLPYSKAEQLGLLAKQEDGLYLILKSDDIHTDRQLVDALRDLFGTSSLYTESILQKVVHALKQFGQLVVWGTIELLAELSPTQIRLWLDGDRIAGGVLGLAMMRRAEILTGKHGLFCSILTRKELLVEQQAVTVLQWLTALARSCDPLCQKVAESISPDLHLAPLLRADFKLSSRVTKYWHSLLLTLLAVPTFKSHLAVAYCDTYQSVTAEYARGMGVLERSGYALSVQFLNRVTYVVDLVQRRDLLGKLGASLFQTLNVAAVPVDNDCDEIDSASMDSDTLTTQRQRQRQLNPNHFVMMNRRYSPCISDLKCVLNVKGMPRLFATKSGCFLKDWIASLGLGQMMDSQVWRDWTQGHVEVEHRGWVGAFNASISLGSLFERLLSWDDDPSPIQDPQSPMSKNLMSCVELTFHVLITGVREWQTEASRSYKPTSYSISLEPFKRRTASLPFSTISVQKGSVLAFQALPVSQTTPFSFHLPLHRFVAACLREVCLRKTGIQNLRSLLSQNLSADVKNELFIGLMEFPLLVLSRAAQVRAGLWRRNGNGLNDQVLNYAEPPFCRPMRDADLLLLQFAMLERIKNQTILCRPDSDVGICFLVHLFLHRLGLFDFCGLAKAPNTNIIRYLDEAKKGLYPSEKKNEGTAGDDVLKPTTYSPARDAGSCLLLLEEFLHAMIIICKEIPTLPPTDKAAHTFQAKWRLRREVVHRLASGPKTHSEMAEVHHVLSHWDNVYLSEEGKLVNPDDATGAALGSVLADVANRKISHRKMEPDKWELNREAWEDYDPSFYHINLRNHQIAAESRPAFPADNKFRVKPKPFCPPLYEAHNDFVRLRRDVTSDATILAITYRTLHMHIRDNKKSKDTRDLRGAMAYEGGEKSETAVARAVHLLTLGAYAWQNAMDSEKDWRKYGGGSIGSIFFDRNDDAPAPTAKEWISTALLTDPRIQQDSEWYKGEENCLQLLRRLAFDGGFDGCFVAQDRAVQAGAAWLCEFAAKYNVEASNLVYIEEESTESLGADENQESEIERRKRVAKEKAMERMKAQAAKFAFAMQEELGDDKSKEESDNDGMFESIKSSVSRQGSFGSGFSSQSLSDSEKAPSVASADAIRTAFGENQIPMRLLKCRPQCIICSDDSNAEKRSKEREELGHRTSRRRRNGGNALAFVGYAQASTVVKGGGGPPAGKNASSPFTPSRRFVGAHVALCGHAIHSECWESYLASISRLEDRRVSKKDEFRCPLCQRLSNCLIPFIDVGIDWIDHASSKNSLSPMDITKLKSDDGVEEMSCEDSLEEQAVTSSLQEFLSSTPWWVSKNNHSVIWDGQCAFVSKALPEEIEQNEGSVCATRRRSVRSLRKKDLYAAWNAMMKTPRFVKRKLRSRSEGISNDSMSSVRQEESVIPVSSTDSAAETVVWRRFMDQVSDITYKADCKRLGDENLHHDFGEFRHYICEKYSYNMANRVASRDPLDWPSCVFPTTLYDTQRQELSREKLLSKLMMSIQSLTYSVCCEANEARRLMKNTKMASTKQAMPSASSSTSIDSILSKYGISNFLCGGKMIIMPRPIASEDDGFQPFNGRLGRLRYFGLALMATAGAVAADLVQLVMNFPVQTASDVMTEPYRAPIVYPLLLGNILTHVFAALCASGGRARARSDSLDFVWPISFSPKGSFIFSNDSKAQKNTDSVINDSEGFIKLGFLATVLQVLLGKIKDVLIGAEFNVVETIRRIRANVSGSNDLAESRWIIHCVCLLEMALSKYWQPGQSSGVPNFDENLVTKRIQEGSLLAVKAACSFLADIGILLQLLVPGIMTRYTTTYNDDGESEDDYDILQKLLTLFQFECISEILDCDDTREVLSTWYESARNHIKATSLPSAKMSRSGALVASRLFQSQGFRIYDWPMESCNYHVSPNQQNSEKLKDKSTTTLQGMIDGTPMEIDSPIQRDVLTTSATVHSQVTPPLVSFSAKKNVQLLGGYVTEQSPSDSNTRPRVTMIPTSYTDLYDELSKLLPESDQTSVCLVCGEVLNAGGKGECTKHSYKCGAGAGMFFLLQECAGLIMHNGKAAYIHSPYVDSHGETPQYRGRPLNLDLDRYDHLREVWSGHSIRQQVLAERESSRQIIVDGFY